MKTLKTWAAAAAMVALTGAAQAALVSLGDGTVKDTNTNLIWLQDWNVNGLLNWNSQKGWAELTLDGFAGSNDWRLPGIAEYANLFTAYGDLTSKTLPFVDVQYYDYWSGTVYAPNSHNAWFFGTFDGYQGYHRDKGSALYAVAVRPGDVPAVPEPQTWAMLLMGLGVVTVVARRRRSR